MYDRVRMIIQLLVENSCWKQHSVLPSIVNPILHLIEFRTRDWNIILIHSYAHTHEITRDHKLHTRCGRVKTPHISIRQMLFVYSLRLYVCLICIRFSFSSSIFRYCSRWLWFCTVQLGMVRSCFVLLFYCAVFFLSKSLVDYWRYHINKMVGHSSKHHRCDSDSIWCTTYSSFVSFRLLVTSNIVCWTFIHKCRWW